MNIRLVDAEEDDARLNWELVFNLVTAALAVLLVLYLGGFKGSFQSFHSLSDFVILFLNEIKSCVREGVKKNNFFQDFVLNTGPHPPTAHVQDSTFLHPLALHFIGIQESESAQGPRSQFSMCLSKLLLTTNCFSQKPHFN